MMAVNDRCTFGWWLKEVIPHLSFRVENRSISDGDRLLALKALYNLAVVSSNQVIIARQDGLILHLINVDDYEYKITIACLLYRLSSEHYSTRLRISDRFGGDLILSWFRHNYSDRYSSTHIFSFE